MQKNGRKKQLKINFLGGYQIVGHGFSKLLQKWKCIIELLKQGKGLRALAWKARNFQSGCSWWAETWEARSLRGCCWRDFQNFERFHCFAWEDRNRQRWFHFPFDWKNLSSIPLPCQACHLTLFPNPIHPTCDSGLGTSFHNHLDYWELRRD